MSENTYYTEKGLQKLKEELADLKSNERARVAKELSDAREKGDLSENAEYDAAKEAQNLLEEKIQNLEYAIGQARVLSENDLDASKVTILSKVEILDKKTKKKFVYTIVSDRDSNIASGKISVSSPIAKGLLGKSIGDNVVIETPAGKMNFEIKNITL